MDKLGVKPFQRISVLGIDDDPFWAQLAAAEALGRLGRPGAVGALRRLEQADGDGRLQKAARDAIAGLQADARQPEAWQSMQRDLEALRRDNQAPMRDRMARLEAAHDAPAPPPRKRGRQRRAAPGGRRAGLKRTRARAAGNAPDRS